MTMYWVLSGGLPCAAREFDAPSQSADRRWVNVCIVGQHLPQMYRHDELTVLTAKACEILGLCRECLGFGTNSELTGFYPTGVDELAERCENCGGTGRPALRIEVNRDGSGATFQLIPSAHSYVHPLKITAQTCLACGFAEDNEVHAASPEGSGHLREENDGREEGRPPGEGQQAGRADAREPGAAGPGGVHRPDGGADPVPGADPHEG